MTQPSHKPLTPVKAIRLKCIECARSKKNVRECPLTDCPLYIYRMGTNPNRKGIGNHKSRRREEVGSQ